jgi:recombination protein RecA
MSDDRKEKLQALFKDLRKQQGASLVLPGEEVPPIARFSSGSLSLDRALGGGWPLGRIVEIFGPESTGKSSLAFMAAASVQRSGGLVGYLDMEHAVDPTWAGRLGFNTNDAIFIQPDSAEDALNGAVTMVKAGIVQLIVVDSVAALVPAAEAEADFASNSMGLQARIMSKAMRVLQPLMTESQATIIFINQLRSKIGVMYGSPEVTSGGNALKYGASVRLDIRKGNEGIDGNKAIGHIIRCKAIKNKTAVPYGEAELEFFYGLNGQAPGIDWVLEVITAGIKESAIEVAGSWIKYEDIRGQGRFKFADELRKRPDLIQRLERQLLGQAVIELGSTAN